MTPMKIFLPVAMPKRFAGAPEAPAFMNIGINGIMFMLASVCDLPYPIMWIALMIAIQLALMASYQREPHLSTIVGTFAKWHRKVPSIGPTFEQEFNP